MPLYDFYCTSCDKTEEHVCKYEERQKQVCSICENPTSPLVTAGRYIPFKSGWYEHIAKDPIYINNKRELKDACDEHNMGSAYLDDM